MAGFIKSVLVFTLLVTVMKGLINNNSFKMYFKFFSGLVLVLFMITPLINFLSGGGGWYSLLEQEIFNFNMEGINDELKVADGKFEEIIRKGCREDIKEQVKKLAENRNVGVKDIDVEFLEEDSNIQIASVSIGIIKDGAEKETGAEEEPGSNGIADIEDIENIEDVNINTGNSKEYHSKEYHSPEYYSSEYYSPEAVDVMSGEAGNRRKVATGENIDKLRQDISSYFIIKEAAVNIWE